MPKRSDRRRGPVTKMEEQQLQARLEKLMLRGVTSARELTAAFGTSQTYMEKQIRKVRERWREREYENLDQERQARARQLEHIAQLAFNSYDRSRQDQEEFTIQERQCYRCSGTGEMLEDHVTVTCTDCLGKGKLTVETTKVKGQPGDPAFLRVAKECFVEAAKLTGAHAGNSGSVRMGKLISESQSAGGQIQERVEEMYLEAPVELLLNAKAAIEALKKNSEDVELVDVKPLEDGDGNEEVRQV